MKLSIHPDFSTKISSYRAIVATCEVVNQPTAQQQLDEMKTLGQHISSSFELPWINQIPAIEATRAAYKLCGKDPNRYRPSQEQLMRRIVRGLGLYTVNALVDAGNELSLITGCSVGCFDLDKVSGDTITLGIGRPGEPYEGIGRGPLNIEGLPVFRDETGGIGTPTSDNERTKLSLDTRRMLVTVHLFSPEVNADEVAAQLRDLFTRHGHATALSLTLHTLTPEGLSSSSL